MVRKLKISALLSKRLALIKEPCSGCLFGLLYGKGTLLLLGFNVESTIGQINYDRIQYKFPAEMDLCGLVKFGDCSDTQAQLREISKDISHPVVLHCELGTLEGMHAEIFLQKKWQDIAYEVMEMEELYRDFCFTHLKCDLDIYTEESTEEVRQEMHNLRRKLSGGRLAFHVDSTRIVLANSGAYGVCIPTDDDAEPKKITNDSCVADVVSAVAGAFNVAGGDSKENTGRKQRASMAGDTPLSDLCGVICSKFDIIDVGVLSCKTPELPITETPQAGPLFPATSILVNREERTICVPLELEAMAMLCKETKVSRLYGILIKSICRSLRLCEQSIVDRLEETKMKQLMVPRSYHFYPREFGFFVACAYLDGVDDDVASMQEKRKQLHRDFALPVTQPYFRRANRCIFEDNLPADVSLLNTHVGIKPSGVSDGKQYLVQGNYFHYHHKQQETPDKDWGCGYRSLQTICSWFQLQGYTDHEMLTHLQIQEYLVAIVEKPESFAGSTKPIGSMEASKCLQGLLNVESKIRRISSGAELALLASDLATHYETQGTPIMIDGGVLAHTIIGIDYCKQTGQVKFLVLDPHYSGGGDPQAIQAKCLCGWEGVDFWDKESHYNLCMPQRPLLF